MLEIHEKFSSEGYEDIVNAAATESLHITEAFDKGQVIGFIAYAYEEDRTVIYDYDDGGDLFLCDGLVRSVLFKSSLKGIEKAFFAVPDENKLTSLLKLRFIKPGCMLLENISELMNGCQHCKNKQSSSE